MAEERIVALERKLEAMEDGVAKYMRITEEQKEGFSDAVQRGMSLLKAELGMTINDAHSEFTKIREEIVNVWGQASSAVSELRERIQHLEAGRAGEGGGVHGAQQ